MKLPVLLLAGLLAVCGPAFAAKLTPENAISAYLDHLSRVEKGKSVDMEPFFASTDDLQEAVMEIKNDRAWLETMSEEEYTKLKGKLRGIVLSRGIDVYAQPDPQFLLPLAQTHGQPKDVEFFRLYKLYWSEELTPVYMLLGKRDKPCVRYGDNKLSPVYENWRGYVKRYPTAYKAFSLQAVRDVEDAVEKGVCSCRESETVLMEQTGFLQRFPDTRSPDKIRDRMKQLENYPADVPVLCP